MPEITAQDRLERALVQYTRTIRGIRNTYGVIMPIISGVSIKADKAFEDYLAQNQIKTEDADTKTVFTIPIEKASEFKKLRTRADMYDVAYFHTPRALHVSLVSAFDAYLGDLLRSIFYLKPDLLQASQRELTFSELMCFESIEKAREYILEKEIESVIRESHAKQFDWMESRFGIPLRKGLACWPTFIELTERRNLFVHCDGTVSSQYLDVCKRHSIDTSAAKLGSRLEVNAKYFIEAFECLYEIGVKLAHVLWRKFDESNLVQSDSVLIDTGFDLLQEKDYNLAIRLLEFFVFGIPKHSSALNKRILLVNLCIAYKFGGATEKCAKVISEQDWSDCDERFQLALLVLKDDFKSAAETMRSLGPQSKHVPRHAYETWPLFRAFRQTPEFLETFKFLFGEDFKLEEAQLKQHQISDSSQPKLENSMPTTAQIVIAPSEGTETAN